MQEGLDLVGAMVSQGDHPAGLLLCNTLKEAATFVAGGLLETQTTIAGERRYVGLALEVRHMPFFAQTPDKRGVGA